MSKDTTLIIHLFCISCFAWSCGVQYAIHNAWGSLIMAGNAAMFAYIIYHGRRVK